MSETAIPEVLQAEAYIGNNYLMISNGRTAQAVKMTKSMVGQAISEVSSFLDFLEETADLIAGRHVLIALGDSRTSNFNNWPRVVAQRSGEVAVINFADWSRCAEENVRLLDFYLEWLADKGAHTGDVVLLCGVTDLRERMSFYSMFTSNQYPEPFSKTEESLISHPYGLELAHLADEIPTEDGEIVRWVARRFLALTGLLERICCDAGRRFFAIIEPVSFGDYTPSYPRALEEAYSLAQAGDATFAEWCREQGYLLDPSAHSKRDIRAVFECLRDLWREQASRSRGAQYVDWSGLFRNEETACFDIYFDAIHYSAHGTTLIADAVVDLLSLE
jgi:hypothetical protein